MGYVGKIVPVIHYTMGGIAIGTDGRVLTEANASPIKGLYAIGEASGGVHGDNRLAGNSLLECTVFGHHVGLTVPIGSSAITTNAAEQVLAKSPESPQAPTTAVEATPQVPPQETKRKITAKELA